MIQHSKFNNIDDEIRHEKVKKDNKDIKIIINLKVEIIIYNKTINQSKDYGIKNIGLIKILEKI